MSTLFHVFMSFNILKGWEINIYKVLNEIIVKNQHNIMQNCIKYAICGVNDNFYNWNFKKKMIQSQKSKLISFWNFTQRKKTLVAIEVNSIKYFYFILLIPSYTKLHNIHNTTSSPFNITLPSFLQSVYKFVLSSKGKTCLATYAGSNVYSFWPSWIADDCQRKSCFQRNAPAQYIGTLAFTYAKPVFSCFDSTGFCQNHD